ncbi:MAG: S-layer family protein, partial [Cyanobacteria bacterium P01_H01_bin.15]
VPGSLNPSLISAVANQLDPIVAELFGLPERPFGDSGSVTITTRNFKVSDGGEVSVRNDGSGSAGGLTINADSILVSNNGKITASTFSGNGGTIRLNVQNTLTLNGAGQINSTADGTGDGGQIDISSKFVIADPGSNSDIIANAFGGSGGAISISSQGIFGLAVRDALTPDNDITAFSELEPALNGQISLSSPEVDPGRGLIELPSVVIDPNALIAENVCRRGTQSELAVTGRGGLPPTSADKLTSPATTVDLIEPAPLPQSSIPSSSASEINEEEAIRQSVLPAQGWVLNEQGELLLTEYNPASPDAQRWRPYSSGCTVAQVPE